MTTSRTSQGSSSQLLERWLKLPSETRTKIVRKYVEYWADRFEKEPARAILEFTFWLASDDGAIVYPWIFKEKYRIVMIDIATNYLKLFNIARKIILALAKTK
jgi:hypothetical protein